MFVIYGMYRWGKKFIGYKSGFCHQCQTNTIWHRLRFFAVIHIYWIPLIPLWLFKVWICDKCQQSPKAPDTMGGIILFGIGGLFFALLSLFFLLTIAYSDSEMLGIGIFMFCISLLLFGIMGHLIRSFKKHRLMCEEAQENQESLLGKPCLYCNGEIQQQYKPACIDCGARVYETIDDFVDVRAPRF